MNFHIVNNLNKWSIKNQLLFKYNESSKLWFHHSCCSQECFPKCFRLISFAFHRLYQFYIFSILEDRHYFPYHFLINWSFWILSIKFLWQYNVCHFHADKHQQFRNQCYWFWYIFLTKIEAFSVSHLTLVIQSCLNFNILFLLMCNSGNRTSAKNKENNCVYVNFGRKQNENIHTTIHFCHSHKMMELILFKTFSLCPEELFNLIFLDFVIQDCPIRFKIMEGHIIWDTW